MLTLRTARTQIEDALVDQLLYAWGYRLPAAPTIEALRAMPSVALGRDGLRFVNAQGLTYRWRPFEGGEDNGTSIIRPSDVRGVQLGRWVRTPSRRQAGYLARCELYNDASDDETLLERLFAVTPSIVISYQGGRHKARSTRAGALYEFRAEFVVMAISVSMRGGQAARQGSPVQGEAALDPGTAAMMGDIKGALAGSTLGLADVAATEIGDERVVSIAEARRRVVEELDVVVHATLTNPDDDLVELGEPYSFDLQYALAGPRAGDVALPFRGPDEVDRPRLVGLTLVPATLTLRPGRTAEIVALARYEDESTEDLAIDATWRSSEVAVADVSGGVVVARAPGRAEVAAALNGFEAAAVVVTVSLLEGGRAMRHTIVQPRDGSDFFVELEQPMANDRYAVIATQSGGDVLVNIECRDVEPGDRTLERFRCVTGAALPNGATIDFVIVPF